MAVLDIIKRILIQVRQDQDWISADTRMRAALDPTSIDLLNLLALPTSTPRRRR